MYLGVTAAFYQSSILHDINCSLMQQFHPERAPVI
jgi:hypothetical protein